MEATKGTNAVIVKALVDRGADVNLQDNSGWSAVRYAEANGHADIIAIVRPRRAKE